MPCGPQKARRLLKEEKAEVFLLVPFTIRLTIVTGETVQSCIAGIDPGFSNVGISIVILGIKEVLSMEFLLRTDIVNLNSERRQYRRGRRYRKTWYRASRFLNRKKGDGWLAPSIQHKKDSHVKIIDFISKLVPIKKIIIEVAAFDIQKIKNPAIQGKQYQEGDQKDFWNIREYVLHRDSHKCQQCKGKSKDKILQVHHIESQKTGGDRPDNLITLCLECHAKLHQNKIQLKVKKRKGFKAETFMSTVRWKIVEDLRKLGYDVEHTYGYITKNNRIKIGLEKTHCNDAFVIAGGTTEAQPLAEERSCIQYTVKQVRRQNRKLFKGIRSHLRNTASRHVHGFQRFDQVIFEKERCFVFGRRSSGYFDLRKLNGQVIHRSAKANSLKLFQSFNTLLWEQSSNKAFASSPD